MHGSTHHFTSSLAYHPNAANRKNAYHPTPAADALRMRYISPDLPYEILWLKLDLDDKTGMREHTAVRWLDAGLPQPHFIVRNGHNLGSHYLYGLSVPVLRGSVSRPAPRKLFEAVNNGFTRMLGADFGYTGTGVKNPLHRAWKTLVYDGALYGLTDLLSCLPESLRHAPQRDELVGEGRNTDLFFHVRSWAYANVYAASQNTTPDRWLSAVTREAHSLNLYAPPLPQSEVRSVGRSVAKWTWARARNFESREREPIKRSKLYSWDRPTLTKEEARQNMAEGGQEGAPITNAIRRNKTFDAITGAIGTLAGQGILSPSARQIAELSGVSERTVFNFRRSTGHAGTGN